LIESNRFQRSIRRTTKGTAAVVPKEMLGRLEQPLRAAAAEQAAAFRHSRGSGHRVLTRRGILAVS